MSQQKMTSIILTGKKKNRDIHSLNSVRLKRVAEVTSEIPFSRKMDFEKAGHSNQRRQESGGADWCAGVKDFASTKSFMVVDLFHKTAPKPVSTVRPVFFFFQHLCASDEVLK